MNYTSKELEDIWGMGRVAVGNVTWESCAYTARYVTKKITGKISEEVYKILGVEPEFVRMSRKPGIGRQYYDENWEKIYLTDELWLQTKNGVKKAKPSRYYDKLFDIDNHEELEAIKERRKTAMELAQEQIKRSTDMDWEEIEQNQEEGRQLKQKMLRRGYEKGIDIF